MITHGRSLSSESTDLEQACCQTAGALVEQVP
jgi:hypothetical protein